MSGIAGIYFLDGRPVDPELVQSMINSIAHRGPDGSGVWTDGSVGLGHRMLWTTPESLTEKLPLKDKTGNLVITGDARIDNRDELIPALNFNGRPRETITDSEIILTAYEKWGEMCPEKLLGDFSFAIWDKRKQRIYCARDPIGIKPFFYYFDGKTFRWASEPKPIYEDPAIGKEPNLTLVCLYLLNRFDEREETLYKNIYRLPPSHFMVLENGQLRKSQYWDVDPNYAVRYKTDEEYAEHFLELFKEAVRVCLRSHGPVGAMLSGGLDSSSIVCTAQLLYQQDSISYNGFETFSLIFDQFPCDERNYINEAIRKWDIQSNVFTFENNLESVDFEQVGQYVDIGYLPTLFFFAPIYREARHKTIRAMLNGIGGDDLLSVSYDHLTDLLRQGNFPKLITQFRHDANITSYSSSSLFLNYCLKPLIPQPIKVVIKQFLNPFQNNGVPSWINADCIKKMGVDERLKKITPKKQFSTLSQQRIYQGLFYGWNSTIIMDVIERFTAYYGIEMRYPFFDRRLVQFLLSVPEEQRWRNEWPKTILRRAMDGILPEPIRMRKDKAEFSPIIDSEFNDRQAGKISELILTSSLASFGIIDSLRLHQLFQYYKEGKAKDVTNTLATFIFLESGFHSMVRGTTGGN
jgi:asparagine synthase (glutamine-hydrolysing)